MCKTSVWRSSNTVNIVPWPRLMYWNIFFSPKRNIKIIRKFVCSTCFSSTKGRSSLGASAPCVPHGNSSLMSHNCLSSLPFRTSSRAFYTLQKLENGEQDQRAVPWGLLLSLNLTNDCLYVSDHYCVFSAVPFQKCPSYCNSYHILKPFPPCSITCPWCLECFSVSFQETCLGPGTWILLWLPCSSFNSCAPGQLLACSSSRLFLVFSP